MPPRLPVRPAISPGEEPASAPPRLPARPFVSPGEEPASAPPRLPVRPPVSISIPDPDVPPAISTPTGAERKMFGSSRLPPPPTRTIALGEKLPPARRPPSPSSDEESGDEGTTPRPARHEPKITVPAHHGHVIVSGTRIAVATHHHLKIYDVTQSDVPLFSLDKKDIGHGHGIKELRVLSMEYRPCGNPADRGCLLWIGTKDGHLVELDVRTGCVTAAKLSAHIHPIVRIFRHGRSMVTLDDSGKTLLFSPSDEGEDIQLAFTLPRVARITEKQDFAQMVFGKLWTATRAELHSARMQTIRVFDLFVPGAPGRSAVPLEPVGAITDATMLPSNPGIVYLGHEAGSVSLWTLEDGWPRCIEIVRVSTSDVLCLEGVNNRLWAGGRGGVISAYDVSVKPWVVTNAWMAHTKLPVNQLAVDHYGIEKTGRLCVSSVGRDEQVRLWDGLLASDWVDLELMKREASFSKFRDLSVLIISWNADSARPDFAERRPQVVDLESRKMVAKNVLLGRKDKQDVSVAQITGLSGLSEKVTSGVPQVNTERMSVKDNVITSIKRGMGGRYGKQGWDYHTARDRGFFDMLHKLSPCSWAACDTRAECGYRGDARRERSLFPESENEPLAYVGGGDGQMALDHEIVFLNGDMNYRIDQRRDNIIAAVRANEIESLFAARPAAEGDQIQSQLPSAGFLGGPAHFRPDVQARAPAWCDRVLWRTRVPNRVQQLHYKRYEANVSDHRPVSAAFNFTVKRIRHDVRQKAKTEIQAQWTTEQERLPLRFARLLCGPGVNMSLSCLEATVAPPQLLILDLTFICYLESLVSKMDISGELQILKDAIKEHGTTANSLEALNGTLRAAKRQKEGRFRC
ncbi:IPPc domain-containing protein [Mycena sanguinolenta]|uniref:IPPc domain-containing protein n=1 Tax=Mycena sanguinolenta TaxID=230812 RepID=A0A8H7D080_9AGAR|nr:IPPc domain-containing protein [Mycena sanguinolenta]